MSEYDFDAIYDRRGTPCNKWKDCPETVIPMTIADMEFATPQPIMDALKRRLAHPFFGYESIAPAALPHVADFYRRRFHCNVEEEWLVYVLAVMPGANLACAAAGGSIMYCTPIYKHIRRMGTITGLPVVEVPMRREGGRYLFDFDAMEKAYTPEVKSFVLCSPHNPVGRVFTREELAGVIDFCERHDLLLVSDEIHCEFAFDRPHIPLFSLCEQRNVKTITLSSPGKTCNIPKCQFGFAVIPDPELRKKYTAGMYALFAQGSILDGVAFTEAYSGSCDEWKDQLCAYLTENRDYLDERMAQMPLIRANHNEGTFLAWLDCTELGVDDPAAFLEENAGVRLGSGADFGRGFEQYARINFACPRGMLKEALDRMEACVRSLAAGRNQGDARE